MNAPFRIGDKVVRVSTSTTSGSRPRIHPNGLTRSDRVYCVTDLWWVPIGWQMELAGFPCTDYYRGRRVGFRCANFRKVEEVGHPLVAAQLQETA